MNTFCPASMCPLIAKDGSPWTGEKNAVCPQKSPDYDDNEAPIHGTGCGWFNQKHGCTGGLCAHEQIGLALEGKPIPVAGPNTPNTYRPRDKTKWDYDCGRAHECQWQLDAEKDGGLCPPRSALRLGLDPRVCLY